MGTYPLWLNSRTCVWYVMCIWCNFCSNSCCPGRARGLLVGVSVRQNGVKNNVWLMLPFWTCWCGFTSQQEGRQSTDSTGATSSQGGSDVSVSRPLRRQVCKQRAATGPRRYSWGVLSGHIHGVFTEGCSAVGGHPTFTMLSLGKLGVHSSP